MRPIDYAAFFAYLVGVIVLGLAIRRRRAGSEDELFLAGRSMGWFPIGLSVMVTAFSAINYRAMPTEVAGHGLYVAISLPVFVLVAWPVTRVVMPFFHGMRLTSAYEFLERRFDVRVRCLASGLFILWRVVWMAVALYASAGILHAVTGIPLAWLIVLAGVAATFYTAAGGIRAVIWTDVAQFFVLLGGIVGGVALAVARTPGGIGGMFAAALDGGRLRPFAPFDPEFLSPDPTVRITLWSGLIGTFVAFAARYAADQVVVQRYFTARSLRDAQRGFWVNVAAAVAAIGLLVVLGLAVHATASAAGEAETVPAFQQLVGLVRSLPYGVCGLIAAGLLAATMSSVDSGVNACSAAWTTDFHDRLLVHPASGARTARAGALFLRLLPAGLGTAAIGLAFVVGQLGTVFVVVNKVVHGLGSPLLAIMLAAMFFRRMNAPGVLVGGLLGTALSVWVSFGVEGLALHYYAAVNLGGTLVACWLASEVARLAGAGNSAEQLRWTWFARRAASDEAGA